MSLERSLGLSSAVADDVAGDVSADWGVVEMEEDADDESPEFTEDDEEDEEDDVSWLFWMTVCWRWRSRRMSFRMVT